MFQTSKLRYACPRWLHRNVSCTNHMTVLQHSFRFKFSINCYIPTSLLLSPSLNSFNINISVPRRNSFIWKHWPFLVHFWSRFGKMLLSVVLHCKFFVVGVFDTSFNFTAFVIQTSLFVLLDHLVLLSSFEMRLVVQLWQQVPWSNHVGRTASSSSSIYRLRNRRHRLQTSQLLMTSRMFPGHTKRLHQVADLLCLRWNQPFSELSSLREQFACKKLIIIGRMWSISILDSIHDLLSICVSFVFHITR